jgi:hypothetical protein
VEQCERCAEFPDVLEHLVGWRHFHTDAVCWELVWRVYRRHLGIRLPYENVLVPRAEWPGLIEAGKTLWQHVRSPARYDLALMRGRSGDHIGLLLDAHTVLHVLSPAAGVSRNRLETFARLCDSLDFYRYVEG